MASVFAWPHTASQSINVGAIGAISVLIALLGTRLPSARYANSVLALWLLVSAWASPVATLVTSWNATLVAFAMFALSLVPLAPTRTP